VTIRAESTVYSDLVPGGPNSPRRTCPACARRDGGVTAADCPICHGEGQLYLGAAALVHHPAVVVAMAVELYFEAVARIALAGDPSAHGLRTARTSLAEAGDDLIRTGLLAYRPHVTSSPATRSPYPQATAAALVPAHHPADTARLAAPPVQFAADERPLGFGGLPGFSAAGYLAYLSRAADPLDPLGPSTLARDNTARRRDYEAQVLARAVRESRS